MTPPLIPKTKFTQLRLKMLLDFSYESIDRMIANLKSFAGAEHAKIEQDVSALATSDGEPDDIAWEKHLLNEEHFLLDESIALANELSIVALYKNVEISTKRAVTTTFADVSARSLFKIRDMKDALKRKGIDIEKLPSFPAFDELRCINNDVKHNGKVSSELAQYAGWMLGKDLEHLDIAYDRLAPGAASYVRELVGELLKQVK
jgi:hypothetical protein